MDDVSLKEYVDALQAANDRALKAALESMEKRLDGMNEFRATLEAQNNTFVTRDAHESHRLEIDRRLGELGIAQKDFVLRVSFDKLADMMQQVQNTVAEFGGRLVVYGVIVTAAAAALGALVVKALGG